VGAQPHTDWGLGMELGMGLGQVATGAAAPRLLGSSASTAASAVIVCGLISVHAKERRPR